MKTVMLAISAFLLILPSVYCEPRLIVLAPNFDFGSVPQISTLKHSFWFYSLGDDTVKISEIKTGCSCALMPLEQDWIAPGDSIEVTITWQIGKHIGKTDRFPRIFSNVGEDPLQLRLNATVVPKPDSIKPVSFAPYKVQMGRTVDKDVQSMSIKLTNLTDQELDISLISKHPKEIQFTLPEKLSANSTQEFQVALSPEFIDSEFETSFTIGFSDELNNRLTIPVKRKFYLPPGGQAQNR
jgi:hypothetical protein